jgi:hypothetical protein
VHTEAHPKRFARFSSQAELEMLRESNTAYNREQHGEHVLKIREYLNDSAGLTGGQ